ncbi:hypothetical protein DL96DRAFT_1703646 [Flagelloscypha sp. PMI_526]|nr:hypothetical protein DL96DRAFT_1703646 [Flagelloscypha sp. PMI_526]
MSDKPSGSQDEVHEAWCPRLKNFAAQEGIHNIEYEATYGGSQNPVWTAVCHLNGVEWGRGYGPSKNKAKSRAAKIAYDALDVEVNGH